MGRLLGEERCEEEKEEVAGFKAVLRAPCGLGSYVDCNLFVSIIPLFPLGSTTGSLSALISDDYESDGVSCM